MIYLTGDTHGFVDFDKLFKLHDFNVTRDDTLIITGDCGVCFLLDDLNEKIDQYERLGLTIIYVDGNHENFDVLEDLPQVEFHGAKMHKISEHIYHVMRGEIMDIEGYSMLCIGGARSLDKALRKEHYSWWPQEDIREEDILNARKNLEKRNYNVDVILTHCVDSYTLQFFEKYTPDRSTEKLNFIDEEVSYKYWFFGHYHKDTPIPPNKYCLYQQILCLNDLLKK